MKSMLVGLPLEYPVGGGWGRGLQPREPGAGGGREVLGAGPKAFRLQVPSHSLGFPSQDRVGWAVESGR